MSRRRLVPRHRHACARPRIVTPDDLGCVLIPPADAPIHMATIDDVMSFAMGVGELPIRFEAAALLDDRRRVVALVVDFTDQATGYPTAGGIHAIVDTPHSACVYFALRPDDPAAGHTDEVDERRWRGMRDLWRIFSRHMDQPAELLDVILCGPHAYRSLAIAFHDPSIWSVGDDCESDDEVA